MLLMVSDVITGWASFIYYNYYFGENIYKSDSECLIYLKFTYFLISVYVGTHILAISDMLPKFHSRIFFFFFFFVQQIFQELFKKAVYFVRRRFFLMPNTSCIGESYSELQCGILQNLSILQPKHASKDFSTQLSRDQIHAGPTTSRFYIFHPFHNHTRSKSHALLNSCIIPEFSIGSRDPWKAATMATNRPRI